MSTCNVVIDLSHHNQTVSMATAKTDGIVGVFLKATQGTGYTDATYATRAADVLAAGLLPGAYHFADGSDGIAQATYFLSTVGSTDGILLVLDIEHNPVGTSMSLGEARAFVTHIFEATGHWPGIYAGSYLKELLGVTQDPVLANCWFWLAQYGPTAVVPPNWPSWTFWQYTDGTVGPLPHTVAGVGICDRDYFNGTVTDLQAFWAANS